MLGNLSSLRNFFSHTIPFSSDTQLSPICSCRIVHMILFLLGLTEIAPHLELSHLPGDLPSIFLPSWGGKKPVSCWKVQSREILNLFGSMAEERILVLFSQGLVFLDHCFLFFWLLLGGSFPQIAWKKESREIKWHHCKWHKAVNQSLPFLRLFTFLKAWMSEMLGLIQSSTSQFCRS